MPYAAPPAACTLTAFTTFVAGFFADAAARFAAHRFLSAATIAARPAADSFRFGFLAALLVGAPAAAFCSAHLCRWAAAIARRPAAEMRYCRPVGLGSADV